MSNFEKHKRMAHRAEHFASIQKKDTSPPSSCGLNHHVEVKKKEHKMEKEVIDLPSITRRESHGHTVPRRARCADIETTTSAGNHIDTFGPMDILAGRTGKSKDRIPEKSHPGTRVFDEVIIRNLQAYQDQKSRLKRSRLIKRVVSDLLSQGCRFLKFDSKVGRFLVLDDKQIRDKVSYAFRQPPRIKLGTQGYPLRELEQDDFDSWEKNNAALNNPWSTEQSPHGGITQASQKFAISPRDVFVNEQIPTLSGSSRWDEDDDDRDFIDMIEGLGVGHSI